MIRGVFAGESRLHYFRSAQARWAFNRLYHGYEAPQRFGSGTLETCERLQLT
jgi:hypothetical protein